MRRLIVILTLMLMMDITAHGDTVAYGIDRAEAIRVLNGACFSRNMLKPPDPTLLIIVFKRGTEDDPQAVADALAVALHIGQEHRHGVKGEPLPEGFIDVGDSFNDERNVEVDLIVPTIKPVKFCGG